MSNFKASQALFKKSIRRLGKSCERIRVCCVATYSQLVDEDELRAQEEAIIKELVHLGLLPADACQLSPSNPIMMKAASVATTAIELTAD